MSVNLCLMSIWLFLLDVYLTFLSNFSVTEFKGIKDNVCASKTGAITTFSFSPSLKIF